MSETPTPSTPSGPASVMLDDGFTVTSTHETADAIRENLTDKEPISDAASKLGKRGAEARKLKPIPYQPGDVEADGGADGEADTAEPDTADEKPLGKPRNDPRARMLEATRKEAQAKNERDAAKAEAASLRAERDELKAQQAPRQGQEQAPPNGAKPKPDDFQTYEEWVEALAEYKADEKVARLREEHAQTERVEGYKRQLTRTLEDSIEQLKAHERTDPGWFGRVSDDVREMRLKLSPTLVPGEQIEPDNVIADEILSSGPAGPRLLLYFSDHPDELQRLRALPSWQETQIEMRVLAKTLGSNGAVTAGAAPFKSEGSKARPPVRPVTGSPSTADAVPDDSSSYDEHKRYWSAREQKRAR